MVGAAVEEGVVVPFYAYHAAFLQSQQLQHPLGSVVQRRGLLAVLAVEVAAVVEELEDDGNGPVFEGEVETGVIVGVLGVGVASALQEEGGEFEVAVVDGPPHGAGGVGHAALVDLLGGDHYARPFEEGELVAFDHFGELAQSDAAVTRVLVFELQVAGLGHAEGGEHVYGSADVADVRLYNVCYLHVDSLQPALDCLQIDVPLRRIQLIQ